MRRRRSIAALKSLLSKNLASTSPVTSRACCSVVLAASATAAAILRLNRRLAPLRAGADLSSTTAPRI